MGPHANYRVPLGIAFAAAAPRICWHPADGSRFTEPFFDDTLARLRRTGLAARPSETTALDAWTAPLDEPPAAIIFHVSRCGSTLLSRMLAALPSNLVVSEAPIFDDILRGRREDPALTDDLRERWLRHAAAAFVDSQAQPPARVVIKLDCWHIFELARIRRAFPGAPLLFVHRAPLEVLVSLMRRPSRTLVRDTVAPGEIGITPEERDSLQADELAAAILGAFYREATRNRQHLISVPYTSLPSFVWTSFPGAPLAVEEIDVLRRVAEADAKTPRAPFLPDSGQKRAEATPRVRAACARWAEPAYDAWLAPR